MSAGFAGRHLVGFGDLSVDVFLQVQNKACAWILCLIDYIVHGLHLWYILFFKDICRKPIAQHPGLGTSLYVVILRLTMPSCMVGVAEVGKDSPRDRGRTAPFSVSKAVFHSAKCEILNFWPQIMFPFLPIFNQDSKQIYHVRNTRPSSTVRKCRILNFRSQIMFPFLSIFH